MPRGGFRPGAGRPKGASKAKAEPIAKAPADVRKAARQSGLSPLEYMLTVMNDEGAEDARRDRMAMAAAPFVHIKPGDAGSGVKAERQKAGERVASGGGKYAAPAPPKLVVDNR